MSGSHSAEVNIRPFRAEDQAACKTLILAGLEEHWGVLDPTLNPDLNDLAAAFCTGCFLTAWMGSELVGTGGFLPVGEGCVQIVRMSVRRERRRAGTARRILSALLRDARARGIRRVVLETTDTWQDAVGFYLANGFRITHHQDGDVYFELELDQDI
jgi:GNAT superfamily N-acetyltransferase